MLQQTPSSRSYAFAGRAEADNSPRQIERNMNATVKTPKKSRSELVEYVHQPELVRVNYQEDRQAYRSPLLVALSRSYREYDLLQDPYTKDLLSKQQAGVDVSKQLQKLFTGQRTYCLEQLKALTKKTEDLAQELGVLAAEWYLHQCMAKFEKSVDDTEQLLDWSFDEKQHLLTILRQLPFQGLAPCPPLEVEGLTQKVETLIDVLVSEVQDKPDFTGLVFVEQRIWVAVLAELLSIHPRTKDLLRIGTFLGTSSSSKRKAMIAAFPEPKNQQRTLEDFRGNTINLILATSVLEEGIDVSSCHLVICFERPKNLKSFIQRRGRARMQKSKYLVFMPHVGGGQPPETWEILEQEMKKAYLDDLRESALAIEGEAMQEEGSRCLEVQTTGARLTLDDALQHLNHFCMTLGSGPYIDARPQFTFKWSEVDMNVSADVTLPISVDRAVRSARSLKAWRTEKMARKDAAFEAYKALYLAGLVNDNLLPIRQEIQNPENGSQITVDHPSMVFASSTMDPWVSVAQQHQQQPQNYFRSLVYIQMAGEGSLYINLLTISPIPTSGKVVLFWNENSIYTATISRTVPVVIKEEEICILQAITRHIFQSVPSARTSDERDDFLWLMAPCDNTGESLDVTKLGEWYKAVTGHQSALTFLANEQPLPKWGLVSQAGDHRKYILQATTNLRQVSSDVQMSGACLEVARLPKRRDFLHRVIKSGNKKNAYTRREVLRASDCVVANLPAAFSVVALLVPSLMHRVEVAMIADTLRTTLLAPVDIPATELQLVVRALTASSTNEQSDYQRLEFLGDCILKLISSLHVMAQNPRWPESYLTGKKGRIVSNCFLAQAALAAELDKFIIAKGFTGAKWSPKFLGQLLETAEPPERPERSSKLLADIVESLIGVGYVTGGLSKAFACIQTLLPLENWISVPDANNILYENGPTELVITSFDIAESLIGYGFTKKMLLMEALTHASYTGPHAHCSYERLEFLGDAILDYIISRRLYAHNPPLSHQKMHAMRTAMANAAFLAFRMLETTILEQTINKATFQSKAHQRALWQFLRTGSPPLIALRDVALQQHTSVREQLLQALKCDHEFPWHVLALMDAPKYLSDIVESVIGAIYVDSEGDISACEVFVRRLGILDCLERMLHDNVDCLHPKERLGHLAVERNVQYAPVNDAAGKTDLPAGVGKVWRCQVKVGGKDVGGVVEGLTRLNSETVAAWKANEVLRGKVPDAVDSSGDQDIFFDAEERGGIVLGAC